MTGRLSAVAVVSLALALAGACNEPPPPAPVKAPEAPKPVAVVADAGAPKLKMTANPDGLSLADRIAKREAAEKKVAAALALEEHDRLLKYDRSKLPLHTQVFAFITKTRAAWDALEPKLGGDKAKAKADVEKLAGGQRAGIVAMGKKMATIDPKGGNSNVTTDYDVMLNALANDYPEALVASLDGDPKPLAEQKAELDKRTKKIGDWLAELKKK
ncbi:MAG TPA: hypothetical protein VH560_10965 [Polyangia bacterium]|jgi:hypothetical protein|nr:hypothetical protein [Polyangia bacterium]